MPNPPAIFLAIIGIFNVLYGTVIIIRRKTVINIHIFSINKIYFQGKAAIIFGIGSLISGIFISVGLTISNLGKGNLVFLMFGIMFVIFGFIIAFAGFLNALSLNSND